MYSQNKIAQYIFLDFDTEEWIDVLHSHVQQKDAAEQPGAEVGGGEKIGWESGRPQEGYANAR